MPISSAAAAQQQPARAGSAVVPRRASKDRHPQFFQTLLPLLPTRPEQRTFRVLDTLRRPKRVQSGPTAIGIDAGASSLPANALHVAVRSSGRCANSGLLLGPGPFRPIQILLAGTTIVASSIAIAQGGRLGGKAAVFGDLAAPGLRRRPCPGGPWCKVSPSAMREKKAR